jgi:dCTP deaminase
MAQTAKERPRPGNEPGLMCDIEILRRLVAQDHQCIFVSPLLSPSEQLGPSSLDIHLGSEWAFVRRIYRTHIDLTLEKSEVKKQTEEYIERQQMLPKSKLVLHPGEFALGNTLEFLRLPLDVSARLEGRSSFARLGLQVHATAGFVDPGFEGTLTFELINAGRLPIVLQPGIRLAQLRFYKMSAVQVGYLDKVKSKYGRSLGVQGSRLADDMDE